MVIEMIVRVNFNPDFKEANFTKKRYRAPVSSAYVEYLCVASDFLTTNRLAP